MNLPAEIGVKCFQICNEGKQLLFATNKVIYIGSLEGCWTYQKLFHENTVPIRYVKAVPGSNPLKILCAYEKYATLFEIRNEYNLFSTKVVKTYKTCPNSIFLSIFALIIYE